MIYKTGMFGGSFDPLHLGHVDCIIQAANMCRELYIVLRVRTEKKEIDFRVRYRWLYALTKHIGNVSVLMLEDDAPAADGNAEEFWQREADRVKAAVGVKIDVVFCGSDYGENSFWRQCYPESELHIFPHNGIRSAELRSAPYAHWDWLPDIVKPYYTKKVLLIGGEGTGKSTLAVNLAHRFNTNYVEDARREISQRSGTDLLMLPEDCTELLLRQKLNETEAMAYSNKVLFVDTDALLTQFNMRFLADPQNKKNSALSDAIDALNTYDLILFLEPDVPFVQNSNRGAAIRGDRKKDSEQLKSLLTAHRRAFVSVGGSHQERYRTAVTAVNKLLGTP